MVRLFARAFQKKRNRQGGRGSSDQILRKGASEKRHGVMGEGRGSCTSTSEKRHGRVRARTIILYHTHLRKATRDTIDTLHSQNYRIIRLFAPAFERSQVCAELLDSCTSVSEKKIPRFPSNDHTLARAIQKS